MGGEQLQVAKKWYEIRPYHTGDEKVGEENMTRILSHIDRFLLAICREETGTIRIFVRAIKNHRVTLDALKGMEVIEGDVGPDFTYPRYTNYTMRRHCALPIVPKNSERISPYGLLSAEIQDPACLIISARKTYSAAPINEYISALSRGRNPEGISRWFSMDQSAKNPTATGRDKVKQAQEKISTRNLFVCRILTCTSSREDAGTLEGLFPAQAFSSKRIKYKKASKIISGVPSIPMFGASKCPILADFEMLGFIAMPDTADMGTVGFDFGKMRSQSTGLAEGEMI